MAKPEIIEHLLIMGDSLSDEGEMNQRRLFGIIPMNGLSGLKGKSPRGRFTNGYPWSDQVLVDLANDYGIKQLEEEEEAVKSHGIGVPVDDAAARNPSLIDALIDNPVKRSDKKVRRSSLSDLGEDISDGLIDGDPEVDQVAEHSYSLDLKLKHNNLRFTYEGQVAARSYAQGGLTAADYAGSLSSSISRFFSRLILATLGQKRKQVFTDDIAQGITDEQKEKTLVVEWSGANDLITVNKRPSHAEAERAIAARIKNAEELIKHGYRHFVLFNLPDLGLTPRYQNKGGEELANATECSQYFNRRLQEECDKLRERLLADHPEASFEVFDVSSTFKEVYDHPEKYGFDPAKQKTPYSSSKDFKIRPDHTSPEEGYMFWDDVHPIMNLQSIMADVFYNKFSKEYNFTQPKVVALKEVNEETKKLDEEQLVALFKEHYKEALKEDKHGCFGFFKRMRLPETNDLAVVIQDALYNGGHRSLNVMKELGWFDERKRLIPNIPALIDAKERADAAHNDEVAPRRDVNRPIR